MNSPFSPDSVMERNSKGFAVTAAIAAVIGVSLLTTFALLNRRDQIVGLNQEIQYDDFAFSVLEVRKSDLLGSEGQQARAQGVYYVVTLKIANHAKRVDYNFKKASPILVDAAGREFQVSAAGQQALESAGSNQCSAPIPAGAFCVTEVVFDLPADARVAQLRISEWPLAGDILDVVFFGKKRIELRSLQ